MRVRTIILAALCVPLLGLPVSAGPNEDEAAYRARRRDGLMRRARERVRPEDRSFGNIDDLAKTLTEKREVWSQVDDGRLYERAQALIGTGDDDGLIREGARYFRSLVETPSIEKTKFVLVDIDRDPPKRTRGSLDAIKEHVAYDLDMPRIGESANAPLVIDENLDALRGAQNKRPSGDMGLASEWKRPLVHEDELISRISARWVALRAVQRDARLQKWDAEGPATGLQDEALVEAKESLKKHIEDNARRLKARRDLIVQSLDEMALMEVALTREAGKRIVEMEEAEAKPDAEQAGSATGKMLEEMRFRQWAEQQEIRLLYITVRRAIARLALVDEAAKIVQDEELKAAELYQSFESEKRRIRLERMLERVETDEYELRRELAQAKAAAASDVESARPLWKARVEALGALVKTNQIAMAAVRLREAVERRLHPPQPVAEAVPDTDPSVGDTPRIPTLTSNADRLWRTRTTNLDAKRIALVRANLATMEAPLVAHLYAVADDRVKALEAVRPDVRTASNLQVDFAKARSAAERLLAKYHAKGIGLYELADAKRWGELLESDRGTFERTQAGIRESAIEADRKLAKILVLRRDLTQLGPRSFQCRVDRNLQLDGLASAWTDVRSTIGDAERWMTLRSEQNAWTFLRDHWWRVLLVLAFLFGGWFAAHGLQRKINGWLDREAERVPELRDGDRLSLDAEATVEQEQKERAAAETKALELSALDQAAGKEKDPKRLAEGDVVEEEGSEEEASK